MITGSSYQARTNPVMPVSTIERNRNDNSISIISDSNILKSNSSSESVFMNNY